MGAAKKYYRAGRNYEFILTGFAYACEVVDSQPITVDAPDRVRELRRLAGQDENDLSPFQLQTKGMAAFFPIDGWDRDDYSFQGPVKKVEERELLGRRVWKLRVTIMRQLSDDADLDLDIYVADRFFADSSPPRVGDDVRGSLWLQGYLWMVPWESRGP